MGVSLIKWHLEEIKADTKFLEKVEQLNQFIKEFLRKSLADLFEQDMMHIIKTETKRITGQVICKKKKAVPIEVDMLKEEVFGD